MSIPIDEIFRALRTYPNGVTTSDLAQHIGMKPKHLAARLGKQWMYGGPVERLRVPVGHGGYERSIWRTKA